VTAIDIPGAFMQAIMDETVLMKIQRKMVELLVEIDPSKYKEFVHESFGKKTLYVKLQKALYGTLLTAFLFCKKVSSKSKEWGFTINPYYQCVANKFIDGSQCTVIWDVDDLKTLHIKSEVVTAIIGKLSGIFRIEAKLTVHRGKVHEYLGMKIDF
jgi:hypothetical protein